MQNDSDFSVIQCSKNLLIFVVEHKQPEVSDNNQASQEDADDSYLPLVVRNTDCRHYY